MEKLSKNFEKLFDILIFLASKTGAVLATISAVAYLSHFIMNHNEIFTYFLSLQQQPFWGSSAMMSFVILVGIYVVMFMNDQINKSKEGKLFLKQGRVLLPLAFILIAFPHYNFIGIMAYDFILLIVTFYLGIRIAYSFIRLLFFYSNYYNDNKKK
jgi:hypothetical protein